MRGVIRSPIYSPLYAPIQPASGRVESVAFDPTAYGTMAVRIEVGQLLYTDDGATPASAGEAIGQWEDRLANGWFGQSMTSRKPIWIAAEGLSFDGVDDYMDWDGAEPAGHFEFLTNTDGDMALFLRLKWADLSGEAAAFSNWNGSAGAGKTVLSAYLPGGQPGGLYWNHGVIGQCLAPAGTVQEDTWHTIGMLRTGAAISLRVDGVEVSSDTLSGTDTTSASYPLRLAARASAFSEASNFTLAGLWAYRSAVTDVAAVEAAIAALAG